MLNESINAVKIRFIIDKARYNPINDKGIALIVLIVLIVLMRCRTQSRVRLSLPSLIANYYL